MNKGTRAVKKEEILDKSMEDSTPEQSPVLGSSRKRKRQDPVRKYFIFVK